MAISFTGNWDAVSAAGAILDLDFINVDPASGDLLVLTLAISLTGGNNGDLSSSITGWTQAATSDPDTDATETTAYIFYRISDGTETNVGNGVDLGAGNLTAAVLQFTGAASSGTLDASGYDNSEEAVGDQTAYSGAASSTADGVAVALMAFRDQRRADDGTNSLNNSFTKVVDIDPSGYGGANNYPNPVTGYLVYTGSASRSCTTTTTADGDENAGCIALFKAAAGGGVTVNPTSGAIAVTGNAPAVFATRTAQIAPTSGAVAVAGNAPAITTPGATEVAPGSGAVAVTGNTPGVVALRLATVTPGAGAVAVAGNPGAVTASVAGLTEIAPTTGPVAVTGHAPGVTRALVIKKPTTGGIAITGRPPSVFTQIGRGKFLRRYRTSYYRRLKSLDQELIILLGATAA